MNASMMEDQQMDRKEELVKLAQLKIQSTYLQLKERLEELENLLSRLRSQTEGFVYTQ